MAQDPRIQFSVKNCPQSSNQSVIEDTKKRDFFNSLGKVGDIEALNRFGDGKISAGLRTLSKISDSVRTGETDSAIIPNDAGYVFETIEISPNDAAKAGQFNPGVLNRATGQAESIVDQVKGGKFSLDKIPGVFTDLQNLGTLVDGVYTEGDTTRIKDIQICGASPYAIDLIRYAPKYKFLFVVQIQLDKKYQDLFTDRDGEKTEQSLAFVVKTSTRPNVTIEHEEINMYNFWTRIPKRTVFEPITMKFYDDIKGKAHKFYSTYLTKISPITRTGGMNKAGIISVPWLEANSMNPNTKGVTSTASIGALSGVNTSIITEIRLFHIIDYGREMTIYHFHHPKMLSMNLDELDMANSGDGNEIELQFAYDAMHITPSFGVGNLTDLTGGDTVLYPIKPNDDPSEVEEADDEYDDEDDDMPFPEPEEEGLTDSVSDGLSSNNSGTQSGLSRARTAISSAFDQASDFGSSLFR